MAYNKPGSRPRKLSGSKESSRSEGKKVKSDSKDKDSYKSSDKKFSKPYSKDKKTGSRGEDGFSRNRRTGDDDKKKGYKKDDSFKKNDKYKDDGEKKHHRPFTRKSEGTGEKRSFDKPRFDKDKGSDKPYLPAGKAGKKKYDDGDKKFDKPYKKRSDDGEKRSYDKPRFDKDKGSDKPYKKKFDDGEKRSYDKPSFDKDKKFDKPYKKKFSDESDSGTKRFKHDELEEGKAFKGHSREKTDFKEGKHRKNKFGKDNNSKPFKKDDDGLVRLNKYLAHAGISSRREADVLIAGGTVKVNGVVVTEMGYKVKQGDVVTYADSTIKNERKVYLLLNKPKDFITTTEDPQERRTVMELIRPACKERIYPVGRLDRNTTGLLLFTNDGDLATKLMHPKHEIRKVYHVTLNQPLKGEDYKAIQAGLELNDGPIKVDDIAYVGEGKKEVGMEIHSGRNRIVRRLFEHLGYEVIKLDRVSYAGLTKKDLARGKYRFLTDKEIAFLKML